MPGYPSGAALLADANLRLDKLGAKCGIIVVEGPSDKCALADRFIPAPQILVAGSKSLVLDAHQRVAGRSNSGLVFLVDCDYDVAAGSLTGGNSGLIITHCADLEVDLAQLGLLRDVVRNVLPNRFREVERVISDVVDSSLRLAEAIGQVRRECRVCGHNASFQRLEYRRLLQSFENNGRQGVIRSLLTACRFGDADRASRALGGGPYDVRVCNGHDLMECVGVILSRKYSVRRRRRESLDAMLRLALGEAAFARWSVGTRIMRWQQDNGRIVVASFDHAAFA